MNSDQKEMQKHREERTKDIVAGYFKTDAIKLLNKFIKDIDTLAKAMKADSESKSLWGRMWNNDPVGRAVPVLKKLEKDLTENLSYYVESGKHWAKWTPDEIENLSTAITEARGTLGQHRAVLKILVIGKESVYDSLNSLLSDYAAILPRPTPEITR